MSCVNYYGLVELVRPSNRQKEVIVLNLLAPCVVSRAPGIQQTTSGFTSLDLFVTTRLSEGINR